MSDYSFPWTSTAGDRTITSEQARAFNSDLVTNGTLTPFTGSVAGTTLTVNTGSATIGGAYFNVGTGGTTVSLSGVVGTFARIVARYNLSARSIALAAIETEPVRAGDIWDLEVATLSKVGGVWQSPTWTDARAVSALVPAGAVQFFATPAAPMGWLVCNGSAVSRATYSALFAAIGTTYGSGDGATTFNLPNLEGRVPVGKDAADADFSAMGKTGGTKAHTLTAAQMPSHTHTQNAHSHNLDTGGFSDINGSDPSGRIRAGSDSSGRYYANVNHLAVNSATATNQNTGGGGAHNNLQPYIALLPCIKT